MTGQKATTSEAGSRIRLVVLLSGAGSTAASVLRAAHSDEYPAEVVAVGSDRRATGLELARQMGVPTFVVSPSSYPDRDAWNTGLADAVANYQPDLVLCAGFMRILAPHFIERFSPYLINSHPALLPSFPGAHAVRDALAYGVKLSGVTVHVMDAGVDTGPIIAQRAVPVSDDDDEDSLHERIKTVERELLVDVVATIARGTLTVDDRKVRIS